jgi:hypothetical protein
VPDSPSLFEHFFCWLNRHAPQYVDDLRRSFGAPTTREVLLYYCRTRDEGAWLAMDYNSATGRHLPTDTLAVLRQWFAALRLSRLDRDRTVGWRPVHPAEVTSLLPEDHIEAIELAHALRPILRGIYSGSFDFGGGPRRVRPLEVQDRRRARPTFDRVKGRVEQALAQGCISWEVFDGMTEEAMRAHFHPESKTARNVVRAVRNALRGEHRNC